MTKKSILNKHYHETAQYKLRMLWLLLGIALLCLLLVGRLLYLQVLHHKFYSTLSQQNLLSIIRLKPSRGLIYDRNGVLLAKNIPSYSLMLIPEKVPNIDYAFTQLQKILPISAEEIAKYKRYRNRYRSFDSIPLKTKLTEEEVDSFYVNQQHFPGFLVQADSMRFYPFADQLSEVMGYVGPVNQQELQNLDPKNYDAADDFGKGGVEQFYEDELHGHIGAEEAEINASGHIVRILKRTAPDAGKNIYLTIDSRLQTEAHRLLGDESGSLVAIDPNTGEVLALVSHPSFDPNLFAKGISSKDYQALLDDPNHPLFNRALRGQFASASTVKPFIGLLSLDDGLITPDTHIYDSGWFKLPNSQHIFHDWVKYGHGWVNISTAIEQSCDTFFYQLAEKIGIRKLDSFFQEFGFGSKTSIDLPGEQSGLVPSPSWKLRTQNTPWYTGDTLEIGIGQGSFLTTPLQLANATAILANRGVHFQPHLLFKSVDEHQQTNLAPPIPLPTVELNDNLPWDTIHHAMQLVIDGPSGTAHAFGKHSAFSVAGKTGTAQVYGHSRDEYENRGNIPLKLRNHHLFIVFAPVEHPVIALAIITDHSAKADIIAGDLLRYYFANCQQPPLQ